MDRLFCDKPYNLDEAAARRGVPRRKRKDSRSTAYELTIRVPEGYRRYFGGKKKLTRTVFALNKKVDLKGQAKAFEDEKNAALDLALEADGRNACALDPKAWSEMPFGDYARRYVERRVGTIAKATTANERRYLDYVAASIGAIPLRELTAEDVERCLLAVPRLSEEWARERRAKLEEERARKLREGNRRKQKPFGPLRVAGPHMQAKVLKFVREVLNDAVDREHVGRNVAKKRFLSKSFKKGRPLIDPLMEDEAARFLEEAAALPLCMAKVAVLVLFATGMRPEELLALRVGSFVDAQDGGEAQIRIVAALREGRIEGYTKSDSSMRTVPLDRYTASVVREWMEAKRAELDGMGLVLRSSTPLLGVAGRVLPYESFRNAWRRFVKRAGFEGTRPYALRHTFATINLARRENVKTVSVLLGRTDASYTLDLYVGFILAMAKGSRAATWAGSRRVSLLGRLARRGLLEAGRIFDDGRAACCILSLA